MNYKDYYQIMGLTRGSSAEEIKRAYRKLARKYHPDVSKEPNAEEKFKEIQEAYEVLKDPEKRAAYEQLGSNWRAGQEFRPPPDWGKGFEFSTNFGRKSGRMDNADFSDFFSSLFGGDSGLGGRPRGGPGGPGSTNRGSRQAGGEDHTAKIQIDLEDSFQGASKVIELKSPALAAGGRVTMEPRNLRVTIPAGVTAGQQIRLAGQGSAGVHGGRAGDLYLEIEFRPHPLFTVQQRDITLALPIAPWEAALGATVATPTLGGAVELRIPPNARSGQKLRLKGRGLPGAPPGDQYVVLQIVTPPADTAKAKELYQKMSTELAFDPRAELNDKRS